jgi:hypothetical protein
MGLFAKTPAPLISETALLPENVEVVKVRTRPKHVVYRYNADPQSEEKIADRAGDLPFHRVGEVITRNRRQWKVSSTIDEGSDTGPDWTLIHRVLLTDSL